MIITTTPYVEGKTIEEYKGLVYGEVIAGINAIKDFGAGIRNIFGGRVEGYEKELITAREAATAELIERAKKLGADAVIGVDIDYEVLGQGNMLMVTLSGTAITFRQ